jgi:geranylgeranyl diphosphate synthase type I
MTADASAAAPGLRERVDDALMVFLAAIRDEITADDAGAAAPIDEVVRVVASGGKRLRPAFCYWGHLAAGGADGDPIVRAAAALELLHTMALIHDDLMDGASERRGVPSSAVHLADEGRRWGLTDDPDGFGRSVAILAGDLAAVLADRLFLSSGFPPERLVPALERYGRMRTEMAAGQYLDVAGLVGEGRDARRAAALKGGAYTVEGPLLIGAALAGGSGAPAGVSAGEVNALVAEARHELDRDALVPEAADVLDTLAQRLEMR